MTSLHGSQFQSNITLSSHPTTQYVASFQSHLIGDFHSSFFRIFVSGAGLVSRSDNSARLTHFSQHEQQRRVEDIENADRAHDERKTDAFDEEAAQKRSEAVGQTDGRLSDGVHRAVCAVVAVVD